MGGALAAALLLIAVAAAVIVMRARRRARQAKIGRKKDVQSLKSELDSQREMVAALKAQLSARGSSSSSTSDNFAAANPLARAASERGGTAGTAPAREMSIRVPDMGSGGGGGGGGGGSEDTEASQAVVRAPSMRRAFSTIKRAEPPLAPGWTEIASSSQGTPYWRNQSTGMTSWVRPSVSAASKAEPAPLAPAAPVAEDSALPLDWEEKWSKSQQRPYFVRASTGETAWERPT